MVTGGRPDLGDEIDVDGTLFRFPSTWEVHQFDTWPQYRKAAGTIGLSGCDVLCIDGATLWIIEMKDYTYPGASPPDDLPRTLGKKVAGTMALLYALERVEADSTAREAALRCRKTSRITVALHVEVRDAGRKARELATLKQSIRRTFKRLDFSDSPVILTSTLAPDPRAPWASRRNPATRSAHVDH